MSHTTLSRVARFTGVTGAFVGTLALFASATTRECNLTLQMLPHASPFAPNEIATAEATGNPGDYVLFMIDTVPGPSVLPFKGGIPIDLSQSSSFLMLFRKLDDNGQASVSCSVTCDDTQYFGVPFHVQTASFNPSTKEVCVSNVVSFSWNDDGTCSPLEGCTPGYWKQGHHAGNWPAPYTPGTQFSDVFEDAFPGLTLDDVLGLGDGGLDALGRHTVAALLNAKSADVNYYISYQDVIDKFNAVYPGSDEDYEALKDEFDAANNNGCPLGNP